MTRRRLLLAGAAVLTIVVAAVGWFAYEAQQTRSALQQVASNAQVLQRELVEGNDATAKDALAAMQSASADATEHSDGPLWSIGRKLPWAGTNVEAVQTVAAVADRLSRETLPPIVNTSGVTDLSSFSPRNGRIDVEALERLGPVLARASTRFAAARDDLAQIESHGLMESLQGPVDELTDKVEAAARLTSTTSTALDVLPGMLGADGPRTYLTMFQNNAEIRATGGMPGALALLHADAGRMTMGRQATAGDVGTFDKPVVALTEEEVKLYDVKPATFFADVNFTPDFPRTAQIAGTMWEQRFDQRVDGVLSMDPVALSYLLEVTGPIPLADGATLSSSNAVDLLLNQVYVTIPDAEQQNEYFADAAARVFDAVASGAGNPRDLVTALRRGVDEGRIYVWSADRAEQATLSAGAIAGDLLPADGESAALGFYLNDATGAKMQYYLDSQLEVESTGCAEGIQTMMATHTLTSNAPADASDLPISIIGPGFGAPPGTMLMNLRVYLPRDGTFGQMHINDKPVTYTRATHEDHPVAVAAILLEPGETQVLEFEVSTAAGQTGDAVVDVTPGIRPTAVLPAVASTC